MNLEMSSLKDNAIWELVKLPEDRKTIDSKWIYKVKVDSDSCVPCYKASLVTQGSS